MSPGKGISKAGNAKTRKTMIELAWLWLRLPARKRLEHLVPRAGRHGRIRRIVAVARASSWWRSGG
jgi:transposase